MTSEQLKAEPLVESEWDNYLSLSPEDRLKIIAKHFWHHWIAGNTDQMRFMEGRLIEITGDMDEHPEFMEDLPCLCRMCCSYG